MLQNLPPTPRTHFRLYFYAAVLHVLHHFSQVFESQKDTIEKFPFLSGYINELASYGLDGQTTLDAQRIWREALADWEARTLCYLPLRALRESLHLSESALTLLFAIGLVEEDPRFGLLFETLHLTSGQHRPTVGLLDAWWRGEHETEDARILLPQLQRAGLAQVVNPDAPRIDWVLQPPPLVWDVLRQDDALPAALTYRAPADLTPLSRLILPDALHASLTRLPGLLASRNTQTLVVRGQRHNGRKTLIGAIARELGCGLLIADNPTAPIGLLATLLQSVPVFTFEVTPGQSVSLPPLHGYNGFVGVTMGLQGGLENADQALTLRLPMPDADARRQHWLNGFEGFPVEDLETLSANRRMTGGSIRQAAKMARAYARLAGRSVITPDDAQQASQSLNRQALDRLAAYVPPAENWGVLAVNADTREELHHLVSRCHHRENLHDFVSPALGSQLNPGVRALFTGPSGTGKTLAARVVSGALRMDLYRLDLSTVVNKYIGETEKNLSEIFSLADELDVILLIDEGDALLTQRTNVNNSNDRYANLETNYLLQRLESYEGIVIITTNASDRIDSAFQRRMDVMVEFRTPDTAERWAILHLHLPSEHAVHEGLLREIATRCALTGGQLRNVVLHATMLAMDSGTLITTVHLEAAVRREYRKLGAVCSLRALVRQEH